METQAIAPVGSGRRADAASDASVVRIPLREIRVNLSNPRKSIDEDELQELAESIRQHGLLQPILVRPLSADERRASRRKYQIVIGSRRFHAAERAGLKTIDCYVRGFTSDEAVVAGFLDHAHHRTLTVAEEAEFLRYLRDQRQLRLREIAAMINKSIAYVSRRLGIAESPEIETAVRDGKIGRAVAQEILAAPEEWRSVLMQHAEGLTRDQVRSLIGEATHANLTPADLERLFALRKAGERSDGRSAPTSAAGARSYDPALRQHGPVTRVALSPAGALLQIARAWS